MLTDIVNAAQILNSDPVGWYDLPIDLVIAFCHQANRVAKEQQQAQKRMNQMQEKANSNIRAKPFTPPARVRAPRFR